MCCTRDSRNTSKVELLINRFYWEVVNTVRKVLVVSINVFMAQFPLFYKGATAIVLLLVFIRVQMKLDPFKLYANNE